MNLCYKNEEAVCNSQLILHLALGLGMLPNSQGSLF